MRDSSRRVYFLSPLLNDLVLEGCVTYFHPCHFSIKVDSGDLSLLYFKLDLDTAAVLE
jgi:hypothetical protein